MLWFSTVNSTFYTMPHSALARCKHVFISLFEYFIVNSIKFAAFLAVLQRAKALPPFALAHYKLHTTVNHHKKQYTVFYTLSPYSPTRLLSFPLFLCLIRSIRHIRRIRFLCRIPQRATKDYIESIIAPYGIPR